MRLTGFPAVCDLRTMVSRLPLPLRASIVKVFDLGDTYTYSLADRFQVGQKTVWRTIERFKNGRSIDVMPHGGGRQKALGRKGEKTVRDAVKREPPATRQELANNVANQYATRVSPKAVERALTGLGITPKKLTIRAEERKNMKSRKNGYNAIKFKRSLIQSVLSFSIRRRLDA